MSNPETTNETWLPHCAKSRKLPPLKRAATFDEKIDWLIALPQDYRPSMPVIVAQQIIMGLAIVASALIIFLHYLR
jgi:hypothetical protein